MIDTSALIAIALDEPTASSCAAALEADDGLQISAATLTEALVVAHGRGRVPDLQALLDGLAPQVVALSEDGARRAADAYRRWGKGFHAASLNYGDCFAYALAKEKDCPLLYVGNDFARTDIRSAL